MRTPITIRLVPVAAVALALYACSSGGGSSGSPALPGISLQRPTLKAHRANSSGKIQHIVIIVQENRSFNNLFYGFPGAKTAKFGYDQNGNKIQLQPIGLETTWDIDHSFGSFLAACNGEGS
ncbi:MAG: alkaline phosphatase family protein, partial [Candidatus Cybelea sp.]